MNEERLGAYAPRS